MKKYLLLFFLFVFFAGIFYLQKKSNQSTSALVTRKDSYWLLLYRKSNKEFLYLGQPGNEKDSKKIKNFQVKTGVPNKKPTPLPKLLNKKYWVITKKADSRDNVETSPYFLTLNIPISEDVFGPKPYNECNGQCNWEIPGEFGLHGVNADNSRLSKDNPGSSGCVRHKDEDITYLYKLLEPDKEEIRYYIEDK